MFNIYCVEKHIKGQLSALEPEKQKWKRDGENGRDETDDFRLEFNDLIKRPT